ncbi:hypothetical protein [Tenacibaculum finnmarkense]|uniref:hypothetical protein n=1 Tax=Tenacibaculum finnmarkense TaxID=2781243 RepID=UPI001E54EF78|nr:hypothetical protein [Tenacibaculum finnmarkense]MCD8448071.1 hypothetical protein [Tenacibaculum finnmarkense genomovar finnmarkense]
MNKKVNELKEALDFMAKTGDISSVALDALTTGLMELDESLSKETKIFLSQSNDGSDEVYCAFTDYERAEKSCGESGTSLTETTLYVGDSN